MFICTVRSSGIKFFMVVLLTLTVLIALVLSGGTVFASGTPDGSVNFSDIKTREDRVAFISSLGYSVNSDSEKSEEFVMPDSFDRVIEGYNQIQKSQGLDISKYARKKVTRYTYTLKDYEGYDGVVEANLLVYRNKIIACDVSSGDPAGFVSPMIKI